MEGTVEEEREEVVVAASEEEPLLDDAAQSVALDDGGVESVAVPAACKVSVRGARWTDGAVVEVRKLVLRAVTEQKGRFAVFESLDSKALMEPLRWSISASSTTVSIAGQVEQITLPLAYP